MIHFFEIETKYNADDITLGSYLSYETSNKKNKYKQVESYDHYYTKENKFIRYRDGEKPELTMKEKTENSNNYRRVEVNLPLDKKANRSTVDKFCSMLDFSHNFSIYKESHIFIYNNYNTVYYVVYTDHTKEHEIGRFIEIEMAEKYAWESEEQAWGVLAEVEKKLSVIALSSKKRLKKSLFEMFRK